MERVNNISFRKPQVLAEVAEWSRDLAEFGANLRDWQHTISRTVTCRPEFVWRVGQAPPLLKDRFPEGSVADAYLAAYAEWLCEQAGVDVPEWALDKKRSLASPWYADANRAQLERLAPESFAKRRVFTVPDAVFRPRRGRPRVSSEISREKRIKRQRAYRKRIKALVAIARKLER